MNAYHILGDMTELYLVFCMPRIVVQDGKVIEFAYEWTDKDAEETYNRLSDLFRMEQEKERKHEAERQQFHSIIHTS